MLLLDFILAAGLACLLVLPVHLLLRRRRRVYRQLRIVYRRLPPIQRWVCVSALAYVLVATAIATVAMLDPVLDRYVVSREMFHASRFWLSWMQIYGLPMFPANTFQTAAISMTLLFVVIRRRLCM